MAILQPLLDGTSLGETVVAFPVPGGAMVPLGELCAQLTFAIKVDPDRGSASGHFITEKRRFTLDLAAGFVEANGRRWPLLPDQAVRQGRDIFVDARLLANWFPLDIKVDFKAATIMILPREKLPIQEAWERAARYRQMGGDRKNDLDDPQTGTPIQVPYRFADIPFIDTSLSWTKTQHVSSMPLMGSVTSGGDLFWMSSSINLNRDQDGSSKDSRATLFREDPRGELLGPLHARSLYFGDLLQSPSMELAGALPQGRGMLVDNYPTSYRSKFANRSFHGNLPEGWTVELYQNNGLVGFRNSRPDGTYEFPNVAMTFGLNEFRLEFHGPLGEFRREIYRLDIANDQPPPGAFYYRVAGVYPNSSQFDDPTYTPAMLQDLKQPSRLIEGEYGLTPWLAAKVGTMRVGAAEGPHDYSVLGLRSILPFVALQANACQENVAGQESAKAMEGILQTGIGYSRLTARRAQYRDGFVSSDQLGPQGTQLLLSSEDSLDLSGVFAWHGLPSTLGLTVLDQAFATGGTLSSERLYFSTSKASYSISPYLSRSLDSRVNDSPASWECGLTASTFSARMTTQEQFSLVKANGQTTLGPWLYSATTNTPSGMSYRAGLQGSGNDLRTTSLTVNVSKLRGPYGYGIDAQFSRTSGYSLGLRLMVAFGREPRSGRWVSDAQPMSSLGAVSAQAFIDTNGNGRRDPGERVLDDVSYSVGTMTPRNLSADPKVAFYTQLGAAQEQLFRINPASLEDTSQLPAVQAFRIVPRPGKVFLIDFPVNLCGEIIGTTRIRRGGKTEEIGGLEIELVRADGKPFRTWRTAYDGFFDANGIPPGDYRLQVSAAEITRMKLKPCKPRSYHIDTKQYFFEGQDLVVESLAPPATAAKDPLATPKPLPTRTP